MTDKEVVVITTYCVVLFGLLQLDLEISLSSRSGCTSCFFPKLYVLIASVNIAYQYYCVALEKIEGSTIRGFSFKLLACSESSKFGRSLKCEWSAHLDAGIARKYIAAFMLTASSLFEFRLPIVLAWLPRWQPIRTSPE